MFISAFKIVIDSKGISGVSKVHYTPNISYKTFLKIISNISNTFSKIRCRVIKLNFYEYRDLVTKMIHM